MRQLVLPDGFKEGKVAVRCGMNALTFMRFARKTLHPNTCGYDKYDDKWLKHAYEKYGENVTIGNGPYGFGVGWDQASYFERHGYRVIGIEELETIEDSAIPLDLKEIFQ